MAKKIILNRKEVGKLLKSQGVADNLERRGRAVKAAAGREVVMVTDISPNGTRARVRIGYPATMHPAHARNHEAKHGTLARALAAGGGSG